VILHFFSEHKAEFSKVKVLDVDLTPGTLLYIPAYWNYTVCYDEMSSIVVFQYRTYMNTIAVLPDLIMGLLQKHNVQKKNVKSHISSNLSLEGCSIVYISKSLLVFK